MKNSKIKVFYTPKQVNTNKNIIGATSRSPLKPLLLMHALDKMGFAENLDIDSNFAPFVKSDIEIAHTPKYVDAFLKGQQPLCSSNSLPWSQELADSVLYTNSSLYNAVRHSLLNPEQVCFSPTSGFHHARPDSGAGFCTFSGQVIAAIKVYREFGAVGAVLDLDGHFGNSIEDARGYALDINKAIPKGFNYAQLQGHDSRYVDSLYHALLEIEDAVLENKVQYVMWCHGADSHIEDDLGGQVDTKLWVKCSEIFYAWVKVMDEKLAAIGRSPLPVTLSLFGGYRQDSYASVLSLHMKDISICMNTLCGANISYKVQVEPKKYGMRGPAEKWIDGMPLSLLRMIDPKKYVTDEEFKLTKMLKNETALFDFMKANPGVPFNGNELGEKVKGWKNHSMGKWAKLLVRRGLIKKSKDGYMKISTSAFKPGDSVSISPNIFAEREGMGFPNRNWDSIIIDAEGLKYSSYEGTYRSKLHQAHINACRITGAKVEDRGKLVDIKEFLIPESSLAIKSKP